jgi:small conductance mechanosensitive channel
MLRQLFIPILSTILALLVTGPLGIMMRRLRVAFLWKRRTKGFFYKWILKSGAWMIRGLHILIYGSVLSVWIVHAWKGQHNVLVSLTSWGTAALASPFITRVLDSVIIFFSALLLDRGGVRLLRYYVEEKYTHDSIETNFFASRLKTLMAIFKTLIRVLIWIPAFSLIVSKFWDGHSLTAVLTSIGAASFGITFGFQGIVRDFITGFFLAVENNLMVGDQVEVDQRSGTVEAITMRTLKIRSDSGTLFTIPFGSINVIGNKNRGFAAVLLNISVGYKEDLDKIQSLVEKAFSMLKKTPNVGRKVMSALEIRGVVEVTSYSVIFQAKIRTHPNDQDVVKRTFTKYLKQLFDEAGISVPAAPYSVRFSNPSLTNTSVP